MSIRTLYRPPGPGLDEGLGVLEIAVNGLDGIIYATFLKIANLLAHIFKFRLYKGVSIDKRNGDKCTYTTDLLTKRSCLGNHTITTRRLEKRSAE